MKLVVQELIVHAPAQVLYELLTEPVLFVELVPGRRVVFTYGWERADIEIPPGSTTVEIDLTPTSDTTTLLRLVHRGLDDLAAGAHHGGWLHYLDRLRQRAESAEPSPDPFVTQRVPTPAELRR